MVPVLRKVAIALVAWNMELPMADATTVLSDPSMPVVPTLLPGSSL